MIEDNLQASARHANRDNPYATKSLPQRYQEPPPLEDDFLKALHNDPVIDYFIGLDRPLAPPRPELPAPPANDTDSPDTPTNQSDAWQFFKFIAFYFLLLSGQVHAEINSRTGYGITGTGSYPGAAPEPEPDDSGAGTEWTAEQDDSHPPFADASGTPQMFSNGTDRLFPVAGNASMPGNSTESETLGRYPRGVKRKKFRTHRITAKPNAPLEAYRDLICNTPIQAAMEQLLTRRELGKFLMRMHGLDPDQVFTYYYPVNPQDLHKLVPREVEGIDIFIDIQTLPHSYKLPPGYEVLRSIDLDQIFWDLMESVKIKTSENIFERAEKVLKERYNVLLPLGRGDYTIHPISVYDQDWWSMVKTAFGGAPAATSVVAYVINFREWGAYDSSYIIAANHPDVVLPVSTNYNQQIEFIKENKKLFFSPELKLDEKEYGKDYTIEIDPAVRKTSFKSETLRATAEEISSRLVDSLKDEAFGATEKEGIIDFLLGHIPFYSALKSYRRREYRDAAIHGILDGLSFVGGPLSNAFKRLGLTKVAGVFQKIGKLNILSLPNDALENHAWDAAKHVGGKVGEFFPKVGAVGKGVINDIGRRRVAAGGEWIFDRAAKEFGQFYNVKDTMIEMVNSGRETDKKYGGAAKCE